MVVVSVFAADTKAEAHHHFTSVQQSFINLRRGTHTQVPAPIDDIASYGTSAEIAKINHALAYSVVGSAHTVERGMRKVIEETQADELMLSSQFYSETARLRSFELAAHILKGGMRLHI